MTVSVGPFDAAGGAVWIAGAVVVVVLLAIAWGWWLSRRPVTVGDCYFDAADQRLDELDRARRAERVRTSLALLGDEADEIWKQAA